MASSDPLAEILLGTVATPESLITCWDVNNGAQVAAYKGNASGRAGICRLGADHFVAAQLGKGALHFWAWGKEQPALRCFPAEPLAAIAASPDGALCCGGTATGAVYLWETAAGRLLRVWPAHHKAVTAIAFVADGSFLATGSEDTVVAAWSVADLLENLMDTTLSAAATAPPPPAAHAWTGHTLPVTGLAAGPVPGSPIVASCSLDRTVKARVWSLAGGSLLRTILLPAALTCVALDPAEAAVYAGAATGYIYSVPLAGAPQGAATDAGAFELAGHQRPVTALAPLRCCRRLASAAEDGSVKVWGLGSRQALQTMHAAKGAAVTALLLVPKASMWQLLGLPPPRRHAGNAAGAPRPAAAGGGGGGGGGGSGADGGQPSAGAAAAAASGLVPFAKYPTESHPAVLRAWEWGSVHLAPAAIGAPSPEDAWGIPALRDARQGGAAAAAAAAAAAGPSAGAAAGAAGGEVVSLREQLAAATAEAEAAQAEAKKWKAAHAALRKAAVQQVFQGGGGDGDDSDGDDSDGEDEKKEEGKKGGAAEAKAKPAAAAATAEAAAPAAGAGAGGNKKQKTAPAVEWPAQQKPKTPSQKQHAMQVSQAAAHAADLAAKKQKKGKGGGGGAAGKGR